MVTASTGCTTSRSLQSVRRQGFAETVVLQRAVAVTELPVGLVQIRPVYRVVQRPKVDIQLPFDIVQDYLRQGRHVVPCRGLRSGT